MMRKKAPTPPRIDGCDGVLLYSKVSIYGAIFFGLNLILLSVLVVFDVDAYGALTREDALVENSTAFLFFLTALLLLAIAARGRGVPESVPGRWLYLLGALVFVVAVGEEISWGQRIFGFETPNYLRDINVKNEFNLHNIEGLYPSRIYRVGMILLCVVTIAAYFARKSSLFGVPFPSILVMSCFLVVYGIKSYDIVGAFPLSIIQEQHLLLLLFAAYWCFSKERRLFTLSALFLSVIVLEQFIYHRFDHTFAGNPWEAQEYLLSIACVIYAGELFLTHRAVAEKNVRAAPSQR